MSSDSKVEDLGAGAQTIFDSKWAVAHLRELGIAPDLYRLKQGEDRFGLKLPSEGGTEVVRAIVMSLAKPEIISRVERFHSKRDDCWLAELAPLTELQELNISSCAICGEDPLAELAKMKKLRVVLLSDCGITDAMLNSLLPAKDMSAVETLSLWNNRGVTNDSLSVLAKLLNLKTLCLSGTRVIPGNTAVRALEEGGVVVEF